LRSLPTSWQGNIVKFDDDSKQDEGWFWVFKNRDFELDEYGHADWAVERFAAYLTDAPDDDDYQGSRAREILAIEVALRQGAIRVAGWKDFQVWCLNTPRLREMQAHIRRNWTRDAIAMHHVTIDAVMETWVTLPARDFLRARDEDDVWAFKRI